jgi:hypothetical protein
MPAFVSPLIPCAPRRHPRHCRSPALEAPSYLGKASPRRMHADVWSKILFHAQLRTPGASVSIQHLLGVASRAMSRGFGGGGIGTGQTAVSAPVAAAAVLGFSVQGLAPDIHIGLQHVAGRDSSGGLGQQSRGASGSSWPAAPGTGGSGWQLQSLPALPDIRL